MHTFFLALFVIAAGTFGTFFIKKSSQEGASSFSLNNLSSFFSNPQLLLGALLLVISFPLYALVLQRLPLSFGFPLIQNSVFIGIVLLSVFFLKEQLTALNLLGILLLVVGLFLAAAK